MYKVKVEIENLDIFSLELKKVEKIKYEVYYGKQEVELGGKKYNLKVVLENPSDTSEGSTLGLNEFLQRIKKP